MGPGAAATFDPELGKKIEGIGPRATQDYLGKHVADLMNKVSHEQLQKIFQGVIQGKQNEVPASLRERLIRLHDAISQWQSGSSVIAKTAQDIITGEEPTSKYDTTHAMYIINAIMNAPERHGTLFRGMRNLHGPLEKFDNLKPGDVMRLDRPSSFTTNYNIAKDFSGSKPLASFSNAKPYRIIVADRFKGIDAKAHGDYVGEEEVITYGRFRVIRNSVDKDGVRNIVVRQLEVHGPQETVKLKNTNEVSTPSYGEMSSEEWDNLSK